MKRAQIVITDECVLIKKKDYEEIIEPTLTQRNFVGKPIDYIEEPKQIFLSSAKTKTNWMWRHLLNCVTECFKNRKIKYGFFAVDIFTAIASGIQTINQYNQRKKNTDPMSFEQEYLNIFLGSNDNSIFKIEDFEQNQVLENPFYPRTIDDILDRKENNYKYSDEWVRIVVSDIAIATGNENDNSVFLFMAINKNTGEYRVENLCIKQGMNSLSQVILMKRWFYEYKATYFMMDSKGVGNVIYDLLTTETEDLEFNKIYPAWTVCLDKSLQISSDTVINDKIIRTNNLNAEPVIIPYAGTAELNTQIHLALRKNLRDHKISLLKDDKEMEAKLEDKDTKFVLKSSEEKALTLNPFLQTRLMINESIALEIKFLDSGNIKLQESTRLNTKDRYMTLAMANYLADKIALKYNAGEEEDFNEDDFKEIYNI